MADDIPDEVLKNRDQSKAIPPCTARWSRTSKMFNCSSVSPSCIVEKAVSKELSDARQFFQGLKDGGVPVTPRELLDLLAAMNKQLVFGVLTTSTTSHAPLW